MVDKNKDDSIDLDSVILVAALAGGLAALGTAVTLLARPFLFELGKQLPLPTINDIFPPEKEE
jgi:hypothetical protein